MRLELVAAPSVEPVDLATAKAHARIATTTDDAYVTSLISVARSLAESALGWALLTQTWKLWLDAWPGRRAPWFDGYREGPDLSSLGARGIELPWSPPLQSITHLKTYDEAGVATTVDAAEYFADTAAGRLVMRDGFAMPLGTRLSSAIEVQYVVGYANAASIAAPIKHAVLATIAHLYEHRGDGETPPALPDGARHLLLLYARRWF